MNYGIEECCRETQGNGIFKRFFACAPSVLDYWWRKQDFRFNRSYDGLIKRVLGVDGHPPIAFLLPFFLLLFLVYGPTLGWRGPMALVVLVIACGSLVVGAKIAAVGNFLKVHIAVLVVTGVVVWVAADPKALEAQDRIYRSLLPPLVFGLAAAVLIFAGWFSWKLFQPLRAERAFRDLLPLVRLHPRPPAAPIFSYWAIVQSLVHAPLRYPLHLLLLPSIVVLFLPYFVDPGWYALLLSVLSWLLISFVSLHPRFNSILPVVSRMFFYGGSLAVSIVLIVLAAGRVWDYSYIKTVVDSSSWDTLLSLILCAYVFFWFIEYWINRLLCDQLLALLQNPGDPSGLAAYDLKLPASPVKPPVVAHAGRRVQVHGGARFMAIAHLQGQAEEVFQSYERKELFQRLAEQGATASDPGTRALGASAGPLLKEISRNTRSYFSTINLILLVSAAVSFWVLNALPQVPLATAVTPLEPAGVDLAGLIWRDPSRSRVVLLAASGGGTRAALYTQSVLRGLQAAGALEDVVLTSGVSGGGAALAYFGAHREELLRDTTGRAWEKFSCGMSYPFMWDVLEGGAEWRIAAGTRLGQLLAESFERVFQGDLLDCRRPGGAGAGKTPRLPQTMGTVSGMGLILNMSLAGHLDCGEGLQGADFLKAASERRALTDGSVAGSRLIVTNLKETQCFPKEKTDLNLQFVAIRDPEVTLAAAAALTANFPPVFSNAAVDLDRRHRYWVTDGGAVENRGMISLLLALRGALRNFPADAKGRPDIHILMADASLQSMKYTQDRGLGILFGASGKIANQLIGELLEEVQTLYANHRGRVFFHDLGMPEFLRVSGSLGTHWMLPRRVTLRAPRAEAGRSSANEVELDALAVRELINRLHLPQPEVTEVGQCCQEKSGLLGPSEHGREHLPEIQQWAKESDHHAAWKRLTEALSGR